MARAINRIVMHHSASPSGNVETFHQQHIANSLGGIGYHLVICNGKGGPDGAVERGRPDDQRGSGVKKNNTGSLHVCCVGNFHAPDKGFSGKPTKLQMQSLGLVLFNWSGKHGRKQLTDHKTDALPDHPTACPGSEFPTALIQKWYAEEMSHQTMRLEQFLDRAGYWDKDKDVEGIGLVKAQPIQVEFAEAGKAAPVANVQGLIIDGQTSVPLKWVSPIAGWTAPTLVADRDGKKWVRQII